MEDQLRYGDYINSNESEEFFVLDEENHFLIYILGRVVLNWMR